MTQIESLREHPTIHEKQWGREEWLFNSQKESLCAKKLFVKKDEYCSVHLHRDKFEIFTILEGELKLWIIDTSDATPSEIILKAGDTIRIPRMIPHKFMGITDCTFIEISTYHNEEDSYRIYRHSNPSEIE